MQHPKKDWPLGQSFLGIAMFLVKEAFRPLSQETGHFRDIFRAHATKSKAPPTRIIAGFSRDFKNPSILAINPRILPEIFKIISRITQIYRTNSSKTSKIRRISRTTTFLAGINLGLSGHFPLKNRAKLCFSPKNRPWPATISRARRKGWESEGPKGPSRTTLYVPFCVKLGFAQFHAKGG